MKKRVLRFISLGYTQSIVCSFLPVPCWACYCLDTFIFFVCLTFLLKLMLLNMLWGQLEVHVSKWVIWTFVVSHTTGISIFYVILLILSIILIYAAISFAFISSFFESDQFCQTLFECTITVMRGGLVDGAVSLSLAMHIFFNWFIRFQLALKQRFESSLDAHLSTWHFLW